MKKRKNYFRLFMGLCKKHTVWFDVLIGGSIGYATVFLDNLDVGVDVYPNGGTQLGSKAAYDWLREEIKELQREDKPVGIR